MKAKGHPLIVFALTLALLSLVMEAVLAAADAPGEVDRVPNAILADPLVYPYIGETTTTSLVISWATEISGTSQVRYSPDQSYSNVLTATDSTYDGKYWHSVTIPDLTVDTAYYYKVYTGGDDITPWSEITFTTAPPSTTHAFTFVALGDSRPSDASSPPSQGAVDVAAEMDQHSFDLALHTGDIVNRGGICSGDDSAWNQYIRAYFDLYQEIMGATPFYPSVGNHELGGGSCGYQSYTEVYDLPSNAPAGDEEEYYSFDWANAHFVALDTNQSYSVGSTQYNWLVNDLQANTQPWTLVFFHHPAYSSGQHGSTDAVQTHLVPLFETYGVDVVFSGHDHHYERTCPILNGACTTPQDGGVVYYVTGGGGAPLYPVFGAWFTAYAGTLNHFLKVAVDDCWLRVDAIDTNGGVFDSYEVDHCPVNNPPVVGDIPDQTIAEGEVFLAINLDDYVSDVDHADAEMAWTSVGSSALTVTIDGDRVATISIPDPDWNGSETITFTATDPEGASDSDDATFVVTPVNDPPVANDDTYRVDEGETLNVASPGVLANDTDVEADDVLTVTMVSAPSHGVLTLNPDGSFTYAHDGGETTSDTFNYQAYDGAAYSNAAAATITVTPVNDSPAANDDAYNVDEGSTLVIAAPGVLANDADVDAGDTLTVTLVSAPSHGVLTLNPDGSFTYAHDGGETTSDTFNYQAYDGADFSNVATVTITVAPVNDPPLAADDSATTDEDTPVVISVLANDSDPDGDPLTVSDYDTFSKEDGTVDCTSAGVCTYSPPADFSGSDTFTYIASDGNGGSDVATVTISVIADAQPEHLIYLPLISAQPAPP